MKKFLFPALALGLVMTSCQSDEPFAPGSGEEVQATFTISVPDAMGTRAADHSSAEGGFSNGAGNLNYTVALLNQNDKVMYSETCQSDGKTATFHPTVVQGYTYKVVAYATFGNAVDPSAINEAFDGNDALASIATLKGISDESEDAYYCFDTEVLGGAEMSATLRRPFGKLRLVATDYDKLKALGTDVASVKVTYGENVVMETHFNAMAEAFGGQATSKEFEANKATYAEAANELTVFTDYLPASKTGETMYPFTIVTTYTNGETYTRTFAQDIPVKRNYLTTLRGDFFTTEAALTLTVDEMFANEETINFVSVSNASQLQEAINNAPQGQTTEIILGNDIELTGSLVFGTPVSPAPAPTRSGAAPVRNFILDLNGKTIETGLEGVGRHYYAINNYGTLTLEGNGTIKARGIQNFGEMTINGNVTITNIDTNGGAAVWNEGRLTINNGTFTTNDQAGAGSYGAALNTRAGGEAVVNGGRFEAYSQLTYAIINEGETVINNATVKGKHGAVAGEGTNAQTTINGGSFELMENPGVSDHCTYFVSDIKGGSFTLGNNTDSGAQVFYESVIADGYEALTNTQGNKYYVVPTTESDVVVTTADELVEALEANKGVYLLNDITVAATKGGYDKAGILQNKAQTIDGGGHTLTVTGAGATWSCAIYTNGGIIRNLTVAGAMRGIFTAGQSADLHIENVEFKNVVYTFNSDGKMPANPFGVYVSNSKVNGWTSHSDMHTEVVYTNCSFGEGSGYKYCRPYGKTAFVNCTFCPGYTVDKSITTDLTFTNCTFEE